MGTARASKRSHNSSPLPLPQMFMVCACGTINDLMNSCCGSRPAILRKRTHALTAETFFWLMLQDYCYYHAEVVKYGKAEFVTTTRSKGSNFFCFLPVVDYDAPLFPSFSPSSKSVTLKFTSLKIISIISFAWQEN